MAIKKMSPTVHPVLMSPLLCALLFLGGVGATASVSATFWLPPPLHTIVLLAPLPFLLLFVLSQVRFLRQAEAEERSLLYESAFFAAVIALSALVLGELFAGWVHACGIQLKLGTGSCCSPACSGRVKRAADAGEIAQEA